MFGLIVIIIVFIYVLFSIWLSGKVAKAAKEKGKSGALWGVSTLIIMSLLVFWDYIPTVVIHSNYCDKYAGFTVNKSVAEWKKENIGEINIIPMKRNAKWKLNNNVVELHFNDRFSSITIEEDKSFAVTKRKFQFIDKKNNQVLAEYIDFSTQKGPAKNYKPWLKINNCSKAKTNEYNYSSFIESFVIKDS